MRAIPDTVPHKVFGWNAGALPQRPASEGGPLLALGARSLQLFRCSPTPSDTRAASTSTTKGNRLCTRTNRGAARALRINRATLVAMDVPAKMLAPADYPRTEPAIAADVPALHPPRKHTSPHRRLAHALIVAATRRGFVASSKALASLVRSREGSTFVAGATHRHASHVVIAAGVGWRFHRRRRRPGAVTPIRRTTAASRSTRCRSHVTRDERMISSRGRRHPAGGRDDGMSVRWAHDRVSVKGLIDAACRVILSVSAAHVAAAGGSSSSHTRRLATHRMVERCAGRDVRDRTLPATVLLAPLHREPRRRRDARRPD